jgi:O-antigen/teichoic acid export membrane protein
MCHRTGSGLLRKAFLLLSGNAMAALLSLARNLLVARMLSVEHYGIAATFALTLAVLEMASALGLQQQIIQARDGDDPHFQASVQGFSVVRGVVLGAILLLVAHPLAAFLDIPQVGWAYQVLAVVPVLGALMHFDIYRIQRQMVYGPLMLTSIVPALLSLAAIFPLVATFGDWRAMLWTIILHSVATLVISHMVAERPYRLELSPVIMARNLRFGWPILVDAVLLFAVFQGEKLIVGIVLGMTALGIFAMGVTLTLTPTLVLSRSAVSFFLPKLSAADRSTTEGEAQFQRNAHAAFEVHLAFGSAMVIGVMTLGPPFIGLVLGSKYDPLIPLLTLLAIMQGLRVSKGGASTIALSRGQTGNSAISNLVRIALLPVAWVVADRTGRIDLIIIVAITGELGSLVVASWLVHHRAGFKMRGLILPVAVCLSVFAVAAGSVLVRIPVSWAAAIAVGLFLLQLWWMRAILLQVIRK